MNERGRARVSIGDALWGIDIFHDSGLRVDAPGDGSPPACMGPVQPAPGLPRVYAVILSVGTLFNIVKPPDPTAIPLSPVVCTANGAVVEVEHTQFLVYVDPRTQTTWTVVKEGTVRLTANGTTVSAPAGTQTWAEPGATPVPPVPGSRSVIGSRFPSVSELTGGIISDTDIFASEGAQSSCAPLEAASIDASGPGDTITVSWGARGGCGDIGGTITADYTYAGFTRDLAVDAGSGLVTDRPPAAGCGSTNTINYTVALRDGSGQRASATTSVSRSCSVRPRSEGGGAAGASEAASAPATPSGTSILIEVPPTATPTLAPTATVAPPPIITPQPPR